MKNGFLRCITMAACLAWAASPLQSQTTSIKVFDPVDVRPSAMGTGYGSAAAIFDTQTLNLNCAASPIVASISSTADGTGNVLIDNYANLTVTVGSTSTGPTDICTGGLTENVTGLANCFNGNYPGPAISGALNGLD